MEDIRPSTRPYRGVQAGDRLAQRRSRFIDAGLDLLGGPTDPDLTVRAICARSGLTVRYFYENFTDKDALVAAVFDAVTARMATATQAAVSAVPPAEQNRAGITAMVTMICDDIRIGRLMFGAQLSNATVLRKRAEQQELFVTLGGEHMRARFRLGGSQRLAATTNFVVGGIRQAISAWLAGEIELGVDEFVDLLVSILDDLNNPALFRDG